MGSKKIKFAWRKGLKYLFVEKQKHLLRSVNLVQMDICPQNYEVEVLSDEDDEISHKKRRFGSASRISI